MSEDIQKALREDRLVDITAVGRKTGQPRKFEILLRRLDGQIYIMGRPGPKDWYANMRANPAITLHLKQSVQVDLPAKATPISDQAERRHTFEALIGADESLSEHLANLDAWVADSALIRIDVDSESLS